MSEQHVELEAMSAHLDGELDQRERTTVDAHLTTCPQCAAAYSRLVALSGRLTALPAPEMTVDEHRELRQAVIRARPAKASAWGVSLRWALAGGFVLVAVAAVGFASLRNGSPGDRESPARTEAAAPAEPSFNFSSGREVDRVVASLPEVAAGVNRYRPEDALGGGGGGTGGAFRAEDSATAGSDESATPETLSAPAEADAADRPAAGQSEQQPAPPAFSNRAADACLERVAATQTTPMVALLAREATYRGTPAWLLVFAWSPDPNTAEPLDRWQTWLVTPEDCRDFSGDELASRALYRSFSGAT